MVFSVINGWAVAVCVLLSMVTGSLWYNPKTFFPAWWAVVGKKDTEPGSGGMGVTWAMTIVSSVVLALGVAVLIPAIAGSERTALSGMLAGGAIWLGIVAPMYMVNKMFAGHGLKIWAIEAGHHLLDLLLFGAIIGAWH